MSTRLPLVLCAEDEESDGIILKRAFAKAEIANPLVIVRDGLDVIDFLSGTPPYDDRQSNPLPALVILDAKMPRLSGFDVLAWLSTRPDLVHIPVVILSSSMAQADMRKACELGAKEYVVKPNDMNGYSRIVRSLHARWLAASTPRP
jgi:CheY-like chemotaxis protein